MHKSRMKTIKKPTSAITFQSSHLKIVAVSLVLSLSRLLLVSVVMLNVKRGSDATDQTSVRVTIVGKTDDVAGCPVSVGVGEAFDTLLFAVASNDKTRITEGNKNR